MYAPSTEDPMYERWEQETYPKQLTELEKLYSEFCSKAHSYLTCHSTNNGENHPYMIIFPDFYYEIIPQKFPVI